MLDTEEATPTAAWKTSKPCPPGIPELALQPQDPTISKPSDDVPPQAGPGLRGGRLVRDEEVSWIKEEEAFPKALLSRGTRDQPAKSFRKCPQQREQHVMWPRGAKERGEIGEPTEGEGAADRERERRVGGNGAGAWTKGSPGGTACSGRLEELEGDKEERFP